MLDVPARRRRANRRAAEGARGEGMADAVRAYAARGWPCFPGAFPATGGTRACSCDRVGCPAPAAHPASPVWALGATADAAVLAGWWSHRPEANIILPTGRVFDVIDVPAGAGREALARMAGESALAGPVAALAGERLLFFVATRGTPADEDEWWSSQLDCVPETLADTPGLRWHCRDSYVLAPPSVLPYGRAVTWVNPPGGGALPDPVRLLDILADACG